MVGLCHNINHNRLGRVLFNRLCFFLFQTTMTHAMPRQVSRVTTSRSAFTFGTTPTSVRANLATKRMTMVTVLVSRLEFQIPPKRSVASSFKFHSVKQS